MHLGNIKGTGDVNIVNHVILSILLMLVTFYKTLIASYIHYDLLHVVWGMESNRIEDLQKRAKISYTRGTRDN